MEESTARDDTALCFRVRKFPAKTGDLSRRWCSAYLKICVADTVVSNLDRLGELEELGGKRHKFPAKGDTQSCVCWKDKAAIHSILTGEFNTDDIYTNDWNYPVGAFHGADGGSC